MLFGCTLAAAVLVRRTRPLTAVALGFGTFAVLDVIRFVADDTPVVFYTGVIVLVFSSSLFRRGAGRDAAIGLARRMPNLDQPRRAEPDRTRYVGIRNQKGEEAPAHGRGFVKRSASGRRPSN